MSTETTQSGTGPKLAGVAGSENSALQKIEHHRRLRRANLRRYWDLKNAEQCDHVPTHAEHTWGTRFVKSYPQQCATCGCETRSPWDSTMIIHDVDACVSPNAKVCDAAQKE